VRCARLRLAAQRVGLKKLLNLSSIRDASAIVGPKRCATGVRLAQRRRICRRYTMRNDMMFLGGGEGWRFPKIPRHSLFEKVVSTRNRELSQEKWEFPENRPKGAGNL